MSGELLKTFGALPRTKRTTPVHLGGDPKGKNFLYCNGNSVFIRNIDDPTICETYDEHQHQTTVARYSPSGYYIASADVNGKIRVWDTVNETHIMKAELQPFSGEIKDLCWDGESKRIMAVGAGNSSFGKVMMWDSGTSVGNIDGHSAHINSCALRQTRPYRAVTGGEDKKSIFYQGPPFKMNKFNEDHTRYVNCVRYSPDDMVYATCGSDMMVHLYEGKTGDKKSILGGGKAHEGSVLSCSWVDNNQLLTASSDKTVKLWDVEQGKAVTTWNFGSDIEHQQLGVLAQGAHMLSVSLSGHINYLDKNDPSKPIKVISGHGVSVNAFVAQDADTIFTGSYDGRIVAWNAGAGTRIEGAGHTNEVKALALSGASLVSVGSDDSVRVTPKGDTSFDKSSSAGLGSTPRDVAAHDDVAITANINEVQVVKAGKVVATIATEWENMSVAIRPDGQEVAVGGRDHTVRIYTLSGDALTHKHDIVKHRGEVSCLSYSPDGEYLAAGDSNRNVIIHNAKDYSTKTAAWCSHTARVVSVAWAPNSTHVVSGGLGGSIFVWNLEKIHSKIKIANAHNGGVSAVTFTDATTVVSAGADSTVRTWKITHK